MCQKLLNTSSLKAEIIHNGIHFKENDKVINLVNNLDDNVFNGDIGEVFNIIGKGKKKLVCDLILLNMKIVHLIMFALAM